MTAPLEIFLVRKNGSDDTIFITPVVDSFKVMYTDTRCKTTHFFYANESEVMRYVEDLFYLLTNDSDPFHAIQFSFPCFPSVMFKIAEFNTVAVRKTIQDRLYDTLVNWPEKFRSASLGIF